MIVVLRPAGLGLAATVNTTALSPWRGIVDVIVTHGALEDAVQRQAFCSGPPQLLGIACWKTSKDAEPPAAATAITLTVVA